MCPMNNWSPGWCCICTKSELLAHQLLYVQACERDQLLKPGKSAAGAATTVTIQPKGENHDVKQGPQQDEPKRFHPD